MHQIENADHGYCYCSEKKSFWNKIISKGKCYWLPSRCQICVIPEIFDGFDSFVDKHIFNMTELCRYHDKLQKELIKFFYDSPMSIECFLGGEHYFGEYWRVSLSESIWYSDDIFLAKLRDKEKKGIVWFFLIL